MILLHFENDTKFQIFIMTIKPYCHKTSQHWSLLAAQCTLLPPPKQLHWIFVLFNNPTIEMA